MYLTGEVESVQYRFVTVRDLTKLNKQYVKALTLSHMGLLFLFGLSAL